jgi:hypothetical protein
VFVGWGHRDYHITVDGFPRTTVSATRYSRRLLEVPHSFVQRNVVLIRPTTEVSGTTAKEDTHYRLQRVRRCRRPGG